MAFDTANFLAWVVAFLLGITVREYLKALVASRLGDVSQRRSGRLTLNPAAHHQALGLILAFMASVGYPMMTWGKPVEVNVYNLKGGRKSISLIAAVGLLSNVLLAWLIWLVSSAYLLSPGHNKFIADFLGWLIVINLFLFAFDLLPIPPLDGYNLLKGFLPPRWDPKLQTYEQYGMLVLVMVILFVPFLFGAFTGRGNPLFDFVFEPLVQGIMRLLSIGI